jgi:hypothetical protein
MTVFWDAALCNLESDRRFTGAVCRDYQDKQTPLKRPSRSMRLKDATFQKSNFQFVAVRTRNLTYVDIHASISSYCEDPIFETYAFLSTVGPCSVY